MLGVNVCMEVVQHVSNYLFVLYRMSGDLPWHRLNLVYYEKYDFSNLCSDFINGEWLSVKYG